MRAIDFANYTVVPTAEHLACLRSMGVGRAVIGASFGTVAGDQARACADGGLEVEGYAWLTSQSWYIATVSDATAQLRGVVVERWWLDCEQAMGLLAGEPVRERIRACLAFLAGAAPGGRLGIYTRRGWWWQFTGDWNIVAEYPDLDLFDARYVHGGDEPCAGADAERARIPAFAAYGGWTSCAMVQWHPSIEICDAGGVGLNVDLDELEEDPMDAPTKGEFGALYARVEKVYQVTLTLADALITLARHVYGEDEPRLAALRTDFDKLISEAHDAAASAPAAQPP